MLSINAALISRFFMYSALAFSVLWRGSDVPWRISVLQTLIFASVFFYGTDRYFAGKTIVDWRSVPKPVVVLAGFVLFTCAFAQNKGLAVDAAIQFFSLLGAFLVFTEMAGYRNEQLRLVKAVAAITTVLCGYGLLIHFNLFLFPSWELIAAYQKGNLCATFINHCHMAGWLEMAMLLMISLFFIRKRPVSAVVGLLAVLAVMVVCLVLTLSRGGWISAGAGFLFMGGTVFFKKTFHAPKRYLIYTCTALLVVCLIVLGSTTVTQRGLTVIEQESGALAGREIAWSGTMDMIRAHPLTGVGPGNYATAFTRFQPPGALLRFYKAHSDYLQFTAEMGILFIPLLVWLAVVFFKTGFARLSHPSRQTRWVTLGAMGGIVAILVHSVGDFNLQIPSNALLFTLLAALAAVPAPQTRQPKSEE